MKNNKYFIIILILVIPVVCFLLFYSVDSNNLKARIHNNIKSAIESEDAIILKNITPFEWDKAFIIQEPLIPGYLIDEIVGIECNLDRLTTDILRRIVFIKDGEFVYDYSYNIWNYNFRSTKDFITPDNSYFEIMVNDENAVFVHVDK